MTSIQFKNLLAFLFIMGDGSMMTKSPEYIIEKANRYIDIKNIKSEVEFEWGLHPTLKRAYDAYFFQWEVHINNLDKK
jgi:hypothetical protein